MTKTATIQISREHAAILSAHFGKVADEMQNSVDRAEADIVTKGAELEAMGMLADYAEHLALDRAALAEAQAQYRIYADIANSLA